MPVLKTSEHFGIKTYINAASQTQILTNVPYVCSIPDKVILDGNEVKAAIDLVYDDSKGNRKPYFVVNYHGNSDDEKIRHAELKAISTKILELRERFQRDYQEDIKDFIILGDYNTNIITQNQDQATIEVKALTDIINLLKADTAKVCDLALPSGLMHKERGMRNRDYNLYINPQARKNNKLIPNDSKNFILRFQFTDQARQTDDVQAGLINNNDIKDLIHTKSEQLTNTVLPVKDFLQDNTNFRDHFDSDELCFGNIKFRIGSLLPTAGVKAIKDPNEFYKASYLIKANFDEERLEAQEKSTRKLFDLLAEELDITPLSLNSVELNNALNVINYVLHLLIVKNAHEASHSAIKSTLMNVITAWRKSPQYKVVLNFLEEKPQQDVNREMDDFAASLTKPIDAFIKDPKKGDLAAKFLQLCGQKQKQEMSGGYPSLNGLSLPGPKIVDEAQLASTISQVHIEPQYSYYHCDTEAGVKNKSKEFNEKFLLEAQQLAFATWEQGLQKYLDQRDNKYWVKDALFPRDMQDRNRHILLLKNTLKTYANTLQNYLRTGAEDEYNICKKQLGEVISLLIDTRKIFPGMALQTLCSEIISQLLSHWTGIDDELMSVKDFFGLLHPQNGKVLPSDLYGINNLAETIDKLEVHGNSLPEPYKSPCLAVAADLYKVLHDFSLNQSPNIVDLTQLKRCLTGIAHSQDGIMSEHRTYYGLTGDILLAIPSLGLLHGAKGAITKCISGVADFGIFHYATTRQDFISEIDRNINALQPV